MSQVSNLEALTQQLLPNLVKEIGANQDEIRRAAARLRRVPQALLHNGSRSALKSAITSLDTANDQIVVALKHLYKQFPSGSGSEEE